MPNHPAPLPLADSVAALIPQDVPISSTVGKAVMLCEPGGAVVAQLAIMVPNARHPYLETAEAVAARIIDALSRRATPADDLRTARDIALKAIADMDGAGPFTEEGREDDWRFRARLARKAALDAAQVHVMLAFDRAALSQPAPAPQPADDLRAEAYESAALLAEAQKHEGRGNSYFNDGWYACAVMISDSIREGAATLSQNGGAA